ncbi:hypothetical protein ACTFIR_001706 [Dictyostelium discoideum]
MNQKTSINLLTSFIRAPKNENFINGIKMKGILLNGYGESLDLLEYKTDLPVPKPIKSQVLIKIHSTSINPLDNVMRKGYASSIVDLKLKLPIILGRECSGEIVEIGDSVWDYDIGDQVWSASPPFSMGSHCEYITVDESEISLKPKNLTHQQSASIPFASLTAWNAIFNVLPTNKKITTNTKILVNGGNGSVGFFILQLLKKHLNVNQVSTTCNIKHFEKLKKLTLVNETIDYNNLKIIDNDNDNDNNNKFDLIFNCYDGGKNQNENEKKCIDALKDGGNLIGFNGPLVKFSDKDGVLSGLPMGMMNQLNSSERIKKQYSKNVHLDYAIFSPSGSTLKQISKLYENNILIPNIDKQFNLNQIKDAYTCFENSNSNGKIIINNKF